MENISLKKVLELEKAILEEMKANLEKAMKEGRKPYKKALKNWYGTAHWNINYWDAVVNCNEETTAKRMASEAVVTIQHSPLDAMYALTLIISDIDNRIKKLNYRDGELVRLEYTKNGKTFAVVSHSSADIWNWATEMLGQYACDAEMEYLNNPEDASALEVARAFSKAYDGFKYFIANESNELFDE